VDHPGHDKPNKILHPSLSHVLQIRASEIVPSSFYGAQLTLRFPRYIVTRADKPIEDALTLSQLRARYEKNKGKMLKENLQVYKTHIEDPEATKAKRKKPRVARPTVMSDFKAQNLSGLNAESSLFKDIQFCVFPSVSQTNKHAMEKEIATHGGEIFQNPPNLLEKDKKFVVVSDSSKGCNN
jgi:DNA ligase 4